MMAMMTLAVRAAYLQIYQGDFLQDEGDARHLRVRAIPAHRGIILDRNGEILAISTPVDSIWSNPQKTLLASERLSEVASLLNLDPDTVLQILSERTSRQFVWLKRHINPDTARRVMALNVPGIEREREYHRYYPMGEVVSHILGFTNIDDHGLEGLELAYNDWLSGVAGSRLIIRDSLNRVVEDVEQIRPPKPGKDLTLSIDRRIQYLAYRELKAQIIRQGAKSGSVVVLDPRTGEVLAMVNQPGFNPNNRSSGNSAGFRNRAVTDVFEPGSVIKPFVVATAVESGSYTPETLINTSPGWYMVAGHTIQDEHDYGVVDLARLLQKSSNVGASKIALSLDSKAMWEMYHQAGFGQLTGSGFPGESSGILSNYDDWKLVERATLSFGYGLSVTPLQLAQAYAVIAADGMRTTVSFTPDNQYAEQERVIQRDTAIQLRNMLKGVISDEGTGALAAVKGYSVAGKTGTIHKSTAGGYSDDRYISTFAGMAPAGRPRLVTVVVIDEPDKGAYFGGQVAAPVFSRVMSGALRLLDVPPDALPSQEASHVSKGSGQG